jgi:hypothetical protein
MASSNRASDKTRDDSKMAWDQVRDGVRFPDPQARNREQAAPSPRSGDSTKVSGMSEPPNAAAIAGLR